MQEVQVKEVARREKGRVFFRFDNGTEFTLYRSEIRGLPQAESTLLMTEDAYLPVSLYEKILTESQKACTVSAGAHGPHGVAAL